MGSGILGRVSMTMTVPVSRRFEIRYGLEHTSLIETTADRGQERVSLGFVWRPL
jgi:hypothetical protein